MYNIVKDNISFSIRLDGSKTIIAIRSILIKRENAYIQILKEDIFLEKSKEILFLKNMKRKKDIENYFYLQSKNEKNVELRLNNNFLKNLSIMIQLF